MIDLPTNAEVYCSDGIAGRSTYIIGNPSNRQITHLVVKSFRPPFHEYLVPVDQVEETADDVIKLQCTRDELIKMKSFEYKEYIPTEFPDYMSWPTDYVYWPYELSNDPYFVVSASWDRVKEDTSYSAVKRRNLPEGELALRRGAKVEASDGYVGQVDELLINAKDLQVTHLVLLERHILQKREITIPVSQIDRIEEGTVYLKLDRQGVEELPTTPIQRWTRSVSKGGGFVPLEED